MGRTTARRGVSVFGLSFLDVMFCGFGSVILLVMIVNGKTLEHREEVEADLRTEVLRLQREVDAHEAVVADIDTKVRNTDAEREQAIGEATASALELSLVRATLSELGASVSQREAEIAALVSQTQALEKQNAQARAQAAKDTGAKVRRFVGDGDRQYLTGLKIGGRRILILVDASASMLDATIVNVLRLRNLDPATQRASPKWQQTLASVEWLVSQLPQDSQYQLHTFNTSTKSLSGPGWRKATDAQALEEAVGKLRGEVPAGGTSLHNAFALLRQLSPPPDNLLLLTDGLPTQGVSKPFKSRVSGRARLEYFKKALRALPPRIPVNTILLPMEGDPLAASAFWRLAVDTRGSLISPAKDWP